VKFADGKCLWWPRRCIVERSSTAAASEVWAFPPPSDEQKAGLTPEELKLLLAKPAFVSHDELTLEVDFAKGADGVVTISKNKPRQENGIDVLMGQDRAKMERPLPPGFGQFWFAISFFGKTVNARIVDQASASTYATKQQQLDSFRMKPNTTPEEAADKLAGKDEGTFLVRDSRAQKDVHDLFVVYGSRPSRHALRITETGIDVDGRPLIGPVYTTPCNSKADENIRVLVNYLRTKKAQVVSRWPIALDKPYEETATDKKKQRRGSLRRRSLKHRGSVGGSDGKTPPERLSAQTAELKAQVHTKKKHGESGSTGFATLLGWSAPGGTGAGDVDGLEPGKCKVLFASDGLEVLVPIEDLTCDAAYKTFASLTRVEESTLKINDRVRSLVDYDERTGDGTVLGWIKADGTAVGDTFELTRG
jgi:hypothetical protein